MKKITPFVFLLLVLMLNACGSAPPSGSGGAPAFTAANPVATTTPTKIAASPTAQASATREAVLSELENDVSAQATSKDAMQAASDGMSIFASGGVQTGDNGRVRLDLQPEGTIVRVGPSSSFTISVLTEENGEPKTTLELLFGKLFVLLNGGSLDVKTPSGYAAVRGSLLSVEYDPENKRVIATCLEGDCGVMGNSDKNELQLPEGMETFINEGAPPFDPFAMGRNEVQDWLNHNPELPRFMPKPPNPNDFQIIPPEFFNQPPPPPPGSNNGTPLPPPPGNGTPLPPLPGKETPLPDINNKTPLPPPPGGGGEGKPLPPPGGGGGEVKPPPPPPPPDGGGNLPPPPSP